VPSEVQPATFSWARYRRIPGSRTPQSPERTRNYGPSPLVPL
jgi:hypothetical protein